MFIYKVEFYYNQWSDSYELDTAYFVSLDKAKEYESLLLTRYKETIDKDDDYGVWFEEIWVIS